MPTRTWRTILILQGRFRTYQVTSAIFVQAKGLITYVRSVTWWPIPCWLSAMPKPWKPSWFWKRSRPLRTNGTCHQTLFSAVIVEVNIQLRRSWIRKPDMAGNKAFPVSVSPEIIPRVRAFSPYWKKKSFTGICIRHVMKPGNESLSTLKVSIIASVHKGVWGISTLCNTSNDGSRSIYSQ